MHRTMSLLAVALLLHSLALGSKSGAAQDAYSSMAPLEQYLLPDENSEIELARSAAPASISGNAEVMVLRRDGYKTRSKGRMALSALSSVPGEPQPASRNSGILGFARPFASIPRRHRRFCPSI